MADSVSWKSWEELVIGQAVTTQTVTVTEAHVANWSSLTGDWFELHTSEEYSRGTTFRRRVAHGPLTFALAIGLAYMAGYVNKDWVIAWLGAEKLRLPKPVFIGDTIHVELRVLDKRETRRPDRGIIVLEYGVKNQDDETVLIFESKLMASRVPRQQHSESV